MFRMNFRIKFTLIVCCLVPATGAFVLAQPSEDPFLLKIDSINKLFARLDTLSPFEQDEGTDTGEGSSSVTDKLISLLSNERIVNYPIDRLIAHFTIKSPDNRIFVFSLPENTGGTYQPSLIFFITGFQMAK
jgi:hypothetical protein